MAYAKKTSKVNEAFQKLKNDLAAGTAGNAYIFYGEETYLREYYLKELRKKLVSAVSARVWTVRSFPSRVW